MTRLTISALALLLGACAAVPGGPPPRSPGEVNTIPPGQAPPPSVQGFRPPEILNAPGLEGLIRTDAITVLRLLGAPRLDTREADMRKLQFAGEACVLDVYLYPLREGGEPVATWVEARRSSDAAAVDRGACLQALRQRR